MSNKRKRFIALTIISLNIFLLSACSAALLGEGSEDVSLPIENGEMNNITSYTDSSLINLEESGAIIRQEENREIISVDEIDEETFMEHLDTNILNTVEEKLHELMEELKKEENLKYSIRGTWDCSDSEQFRYVAGLGPKAVMPMYYILYKSDQAGRYEYIVSLAMNDIIGYDFYNDKSYQWADAYEFRERYNSCVQESVSQFYAILDDSSKSKEEKIDYIKNLGIFVIAQLLNEIDYKNSEFDKDTICSVIKEILGKAGYDENFEDINVWRETNEEYYRNIIKILPSRHEQ